MAISQNVDDIKLSDEGYRFLVAITGYRTKPWKTSDGSLMVGFKHVGDDLEWNREYTDKEIYEFFQKDKEIYEKDVRKIFDPRFMSQHMFDAMFCFCYSVGTISSTDLGRMIKKNPFDERIKHLWEYTYTNGGKNKTLAKRRRREVEFYFMDDSENMDTSIFFGESETD